MTTQVYIPEQQGILSKLFGGMQSLSQGASAYSTISKAFGGGAAATTASPAAGGGIAAGGAAKGSGMGLGVGNVTPVTSGMSPVLGGGAPAGGATAAGSGGGTAAAMGSSIMGPAAAVAGGYYANYQIGKAMDEKRDKANDKAKAAYRANPGLAVDFNDEYQPMGQAPSGLQLTGSKADGMGAMERRMSSQQTAMQDIQAAQEQLNVAGLPTDERRRIGQKLELARQQIGGQNRGNKRLYT